MINVETNPIRGLSANRLEIPSSLGLLQNGMSADDQAGIRSSTSNDSLCPALPDGTSQHVPPERLPPLARFLLLKFARCVRQHGAGSFRRVHARCRGLSEGVGEVLECEREEVRKGVSSTVTFHSDNYERTSSQRSKTTSIMIMGSLP